MTETGMHGVDANHGEANHGEANHGGADHGGADHGWADEGWPPGWADAAAMRVLARLDPLPPQRAAAVGRRWAGAFPGRGRRSGLPGWSAGLPRLAAATAAAMALGGVVAMLVPPLGEGPDRDVSALILDAGPGIGLAQ